MASVRAELKRRNVVKVAAAYAIVGWVLVEVSATVLPAFEAPDWILRVIILLVAIGFILALILSWAYELTPDGLIPTHEVDQAASITHVTGQKLNYTVIGVLALVICVLMVREFLPQDVDPDAVTREGSTTAESATESMAPLEQERNRQVLANSVAALPFENLSADPEDAYFATGIHEEILNQWVKLSALNVIARTSVLQYAGGNKTIPEIAGELNAVNML